MTRQRLRDAVPGDETLYHDWPVRRGASRVGLTAERLLLVGNETYSVPYENVAEVTVQSFDWFLALLSVGLVAIGAVQTGTNLPLGLFFALAGLASLALTFRKRGKIRVEMHAKPQALVFYLEETEPFEQAMDEGLRAFEENRGEEEPTRRT